jgi:hypothetical protein
MKAKDVLVFGAVGIGLYYIYKAVSGVSNAVTGGVSAATCGISSGIASLFSPGPSTMNVQGNVIFPNGAQVALSSLQVSCGGTVQYQGGVYQLSPSDSNGNYPATQIS